MIDKIKKINWIEEVRRPNPLLPWYQIAKGSINVGELLETEITYSNFLVLTDTSYKDREEFYSLVRETFRRLKEREGFINTLEEKRRKWFGKITRDVKTIAEDVEKKDKEELLDILAYLFKIEPKVYSFFHLKNILSESMKNILVENLRMDGIKNEKTIEEIIARFSFPEERNVYQKRELELFKISQTSKNKKDLLDKLVNFIEKYRWTYFSHYTGESPSIESLLEKITSRKFNENMKENIATSVKRLKEMEKIIHEYKLSSTTVDNLKKFRKLLTFNEKVLSSVFFFQYAELPIYSRVSSYLNQKIENLVKYPPSLIKKFYEKGKVYKNPFHQFAIVVLDKKLSLFTKEEELKDLENFLYLERVETVIKGNPVYPGNVKGQVTIVEKKSDRIKVKENTIIVTPMITPTDVDIILKAKGVITDEGGILTHAAILCREFKVPGIVGAKVASKILKDGDEVFLDATKGIIKKIKRGENVSSSKSD